jgi:hypothetical protein
MNDLIAIRKIAGWEKLKTLVLDRIPRLLGTAPDDVDFPQHGPRLAANWSFQASQFQARDSLGGSGKRSSNPRDQVAECLDFFSLGTSGWPRSTAPRVDIHSDLNLSVANY